MNRSESVITVAPLGRNEKVTNYPAVENLQEVTPADMLKHCAPVPKCDYHLRVEFEDGHDVFLSFDGKVRTEEDDDREFLLADIWNLHIDGFPTSPADVEFLLETDLEVIEEFLIARDQGEVDEVEPAASELPPLSPPVDHCHVSTGPLWKRQAAVRGVA